MRRAISIAFALPLFGCAISNADVAKRCALDENQLNAAFQEMDSLVSGESRTFGLCTFTRGAGQQRVAIVITKHGRPVGS